MTSVITKREYSGKEFGLPNPKPLTKAWRIKRGIFAPAPLAVGATTTLSGQDSVTADDLTRGLAVYAGYADGSYANMNEVKAAVGSAPVIVSITPNGISGPRCFDVEPGDGTPSQTPAWVKLPSHGGPAWGQKDAGKPVIYCSAGDTQAVINACSGAGIARSAYLIWSAHWIGRHICAPNVCGYPAADACQYASNSKYDSDVWYSYCFAAPTPPPPPPPPADWSYAAPADLHVIAAGHTTVKLGWDQPALAGHPKPDHYVVWIYDNGKLVGSYPRNVPAGTTATSYVWEGGGLQVGVHYVAHVGTSGSGTSHLGKDVFASASFTTG